MARVWPQAEERQKEVEGALRAAFAKAIRREDVEVIAFSEIKPEVLGEAIFQFPIVLKPLLSACNIAARTIERDLHIRNLNTYKPRFTHDQALTIAGFIKPYLPAAAPLPSLAYLDRAMFIDKEVRKGKGHWESSIRDALNRLAVIRFKKRKFKWSSEAYELDAAAPETGPITYAIDIKRIEARRDIHKRSDEIVNKADLFKRAFPHGKFGTVIYYPFIQEQSNVQDRLRSEKIDSVVFASEDEESITNAVALLLAKFRIRRR